MTRLVKVLCLDPSKTALGMALINVHPQTLEIIPDSLSLVQTAKTDLKQVRKNSDDLRRATEQANALRDMVDWADIVMSEVPHGSQSAAGAFSNGVCIGLLAWVYKPLIQVQAFETKLATVGRKTATKEEMIHWATTLYPSLNWHRDRGKPDGRILASNEHLADALGVGHAGVKTTDFKAALAMFNAVNRTAA